MPFKSDSQRRKFGEMVKQGKISQATFDEWNKDTPSKLPDRISNDKIRSISDLRKVKVK
jgi:hypothetical protein